LGIRHLLDAPLGNPRKRCERNRELIGSHRERLSVKVSPADHFA
jgi:hypothetical protein